MFQGLTLTVTLTLTPTLRSICLAAQDMVDQYLMSVAAPKAIAPVIDLTLAQQVICPSVPHQSERLEPAQALSLDVDKAGPIL